MMCMPKCVDCVWLRTLILWDNKLNNKNGFFFSCGQKNKLISDNIWYDETGFVQQHTISLSKIVDRSTEQKNKNEFNPGHTKRNYTAWNIVIITNREWTKFTCDFRPIEITAMVLLCLVVAKVVSMSHFSTSWQVIYLSFVVHFSFHCCSHSRSVWIMTSYYNVFFL